MRLSLNRKLFIIKFSLYLIGGEKKMIKEKLPSLVVLSVFVVALGIASTGAEPGNPFKPIWDAIYDLQNQTDNLQNQINDIQIGPTIVRYGVTQVFPAQPTALVVECSTRTGGGFYAEPGIEIYQNFPSPPQAMRGSLQGQTPQGKRNIYTLT